MSYFVLMLILCYVTVDAATDARSTNDVCSLPVSSGSCNQTLSRFYYDSSSGRCLSFVYTGCQGNGNKFRSERGCQRRCYDRCSLPMSGGACEESISMWYYDSSTYQCLQFNYTGCRGNRNRFSSRSRCLSTCQRNTSPNSDSESNEENDLINLSVCSLASETGPCRAHIAKWFYNSEVGACEQFVYGGCGGNGNKFDNRHQCEERCGSAGTTQQTPQTTRDQVCSLPSVMGNCKARMPKFYYNSQSGRCEGFIYGGCGGNDNRFDTAQQCEERCGAAEQQQEQNVCSLPSDPGNCKANIPKWYYNPSRGRCKTFIYGGCGGNGNKFDSQQLCEQRCGASEPDAEPEPGDQQQGGDVCQLPSETGNCKARIPKWYYNTYSRTCEQFIYGGCGGNENNFNTEQLCQERCVVAESTTPPLVVQPLSNTGDGGSTNSICHLPARTGRCFASFQRYYYNPAKNACITFTYGGCDGNANNFRSVEDCERQCMTPQTSTSPTDGDDDDLSPQPALCSLPYVTGPCRASFGRFYYNQETGRCTAFIYGGCRGNANNFRSVQQCQETCYRVPVPKPMVGIMQQGEELDPGNPCTLPKVVGPCRGRLPRFYYDTATRRCLGFAYGGCQGNANNFRTIEECSNRCPRESTPNPSTDLCSMPALTGPCRGSFGRWFYNAQAAHCEAFVYGGCRGNSNNFLTRSACEQRCPDAGDDSSNRALAYEHTARYPAACRQAQDAGLCSAMVSRWFFDVAAMRCERFAYGGCGGNDNNFNTRMACEEACMSIASEGTSSPSTVSNTGNVCELPAETGNCRARLPRWYYNAQSQACETFIYGGCGGNQNNFQSKSQCQAKCNSAQIGNQNVQDLEITTEMATSTILASGALDYCSLPPVVGPCRARHPRWYYNTRVGRCIAFTYGGCRGNNNRFTTHEQCMQTCSRTAGDNPNQATADHVEDQLNQLNSDGQSVVISVMDNNPADQQSLPNDQQQQNGQQDEQDEEEDICMLPKVVGRCYALLPRWFYNSATSRCESFSYGGCDGNANNFRSEELCTAACA